MMKIVLVFLWSLSVSASDLPHAPTSFPYQDSKAIFADWISAHYHITYDGPQKKATVKSSIKLITLEAGFILFDLKVNPTLVTLNHEVVDFKNIKTPDQATQLKILTTKVPAGEYLLELESPLTNLITFTGTGVRSAFWTTDLQDRGYLEQYLPANFEFDRVPMNLTIDFIGLPDQIIYSNGSMSNNGTRTEIQFPPYFTSSSIFYHTTPKQEVKEIRFDYPSIDGRSIPVVIYARAASTGNPAGQLPQFKTQTLAVLKELENDYGPFLHPSVTIYNAGSGGMEYCGATMTEYSALDHELTHSYFARGIMPANGNSGWIDEALASWRDNGYPRKTSLTGSKNMAGRAYYTRYTDMNAYGFGANFMALLDGTLQDQGGLKPFLKKLVADQKFNPYFTEEFAGFLEAYTQKTLMPLFRQHVYPAKGSSSREEKQVLDHPRHQKLSLEQLQNYL